MGDSVLSEGQQVMQRFVETYDHGKMSNRYLETYIHDANAESDEKDEAFENLHALKLPADVTVTPPPLPFFCFRRAHTTKGLL